MDLNGLWGSFRLQYISLSGWVEENLGDLHPGHLQLGSFSIAMLDYRRVPVNGELFFE